MAIKREDLIPSILNKVRQTFNDNQGWVRQGKFTPKQQVQTFTNKMTDDTGLFRGNKFGVPTFTPLKALGDYSYKGGPTVREAFNKLPEQAQQDWGQAGLVRNNPLLQKFAPKAIEPLATAVELGPAAYMNTWSKGLTTFSRDTTIPEKAWDLLGVYGSLNPAYATKNLASGPLGVGFNAITNKVSGKPALENWKQGWQQGQEFQFHANPLNQATGNLVNQIAKNVPFLQKLTNEVIANNKINPTDSLKQAFGKWITNSGKQLVKAATLETIVETPIWATMTKTEQETYLEAVQREALQNLTMNVGMAGLSSLVDTRSLAPIVKNSIDTAATNYWKYAISPEGIKKQGGYIDFMGNTVDGTDRTNRFNNLVDAYYKPNATVKEKVDAYAEIRRLAGDVFSKEKIKQLTDIETNKDPENLIMALSDTLNKDIKTNRGYQEPFTIKNLLANKELQRGGMDLTDKTKPFPQEAGTKVSQLEPKIDGKIKIKPSEKIKVISENLNTQPIKETVLPWEEPSYVSKNLGIKTKETPVLKTGILKQELNQLQTKAPLKAQSIISPELTNDIKKVENIAPKKVNLLDWFRTPDRVLTKIGLGEEGKQIRSAYNKYLDDLPVELSKVTKWYDQVKGSPDASQRIFKYLDGQDVVLNKTETKVAGEIQDYLKDWADKLGLPDDKRVTNYITHIFEKDFIKKDFDEDLAKIISEKVPGSVYDPFTQERLGKQGYIEDVFKSLDAYIKRGVRKINMDPALEKLSNASNKLPLESWKYVKSFADRVNLRPTEIDNYIDNLIKESPIGYKLGARPVTATTRKLRQAVYRGTLGLNVGSALRNLTQGVNTYAELGEKYTPIGYIRNLKEMATGGDELKRVGVLRDDLIQDRQLSAVKGVMQKLDEGLFAFFNLAEKINRGSAYFGAKAKYLDQGLNEKQAIEKAVDLVRKTQFTFGSVDTPVAMQSDLAKTLGQFQSFNLKQLEFLGEKIASKDVIGLLRWIGGNALMMFTVGNLIGIDVKDIIPFGGVLTGDTKLGVTPPVQLGSDIYGAITNTPDKYGNISEDNMFKRVSGAVTKNLPAWIPAGVQAKKTIQGIKAVNEEGSFSKSGRLQYPIEKTPENYIRAGLFGKSNLPAAREYFDNNGSVLGEKQTEFYKQSNDKQGIYKSFITKRQEENAIKEAKKQLETSGGIQNVNGKILYEKNGDIKTIDLGKVTSMPEQTAYQRALKEKQKYTLVDDILDNLSGDQQIEALQALGISSEDATYYNTARQENYLKSIYVEEEIMTMIQQGQNKDQILNSLASMRKAVNEKILLSDGVINDLVDKNIISYADGKALKNIDKDLKPKKLKAKKPKKISLSSKKFTAYKKKYNPLKVKSTTTKSRFTPPKYIKADLRTPTKLL